MNLNKQHKPGCLENVSCLVIHPDGICPGPYGKCTCNEIESKEQKKCGKLIHASGGTTCENDVPCFLHPTESKDWRYCSKCKVKFITSDKRDICPQCRWGKAKKLTDEGGEATANFNPLLSSYILQEKEKSYQEGLYKGYEEEAVGCFEHCEEVRQSMLREIMEMMIQVWGDCTVYGYEKGLRAFESKLKSKLTQK